MIFGEYRQGLLRDQSTSESEELHTTVQRLRELARAHSHAGRLRDKDRRILDRMAECFHTRDCRESRLRCPECSQHLSVCSIDHTDIDCCRICHSIWLDRGELSHITGHSTEIPGTRLHHRPSKRCCPVCGEVMTEYQFCHGQNLLVDSCPAGHGVYLQDGELERVLRAGNVDLT